MPAVNLFLYNESAPTSPAIFLIEVTPADADLDYVCRMLYVGTGGTVVVRDKAGTVVTHTNVSSGSYLGPFAIDRVTAATTATNLIGYV